MTQYSIGGIDITLHELLPEGGHCWGGEQHYGVHNCQWAAHLVVRSGYRGPLLPVYEFLPSFSAGNREKFDGGRCCARRLPRPAPASSSTRLKAPGPDAYPGAPSTRARVSTGNHATLNTAKVAIQHACDSRIHVV